MAIEMLHDRTLKAIGDQAVKKSEIYNTDNKNVSKVKAEDADTDAVLLTNSAKNLSVATQTAKDADGIDYAKVEALQKQIKDGTYSINYERLADKIVASESELSSLF